MYKVARQDRCDNAVAFRQSSEPPGDMATVAPKLHERWVERFLTWCVDVVEGVEGDATLRGSCRERRKKARDHCLTGTVGTGRYPAAC